MTLLQQEKIAQQQGVTTELVPTKEISPSFESALLTAVNPATRDSVLEQNRPAFTSTSSSEALASKAADQATERIIKLKGGKDATQDEMSLSFARSMGNIETEVKEHRPFNPQEKEDLTEAVDKSTLTEETKEQLKNALENDQPLSEEQQEELKLAVGELAKNESITEEQKQDLTKAIERPLSQEQTQALVLAVETSQTLSTEQQEELVGALKEGEPLSDEQKTQIADAYEELQETILELDLKDYNEISKQDLNQVSKAIEQSNTLTEEQKESLTTALNSDLRLTTEQEESLSALSQEEGVSVQQQQAIKNVVEDYRPISEPQKERLVEAIGESELLTTEQKNEITQKLESGETLSSADTKAASVALKEAEYRKLEQAVEHPETMTDRQRQEVIKVVEEQVQGNDVEALKTAVREGHQLDADQKKQINEALQQSLERELQTVSTPLESQSPEVRFQVASFLNDLDPKTRVDISAILAMNFGDVPHRAWDFLEDKHPSTNTQNISQRHPEPEVKTPQTVTLELPNAKLETPFNSQQTALINQQQESQNEQPQRQQRTTIQPGAINIALNTSTLLETLQHRDQPQHTATSSSSNTIKPDTETPVTNTQKLVATTNQRPSINEIDIDKLDLSVPAA